jgi:sigma-E factor negative regulatory protein RseB
MKMPLALHSFLWLSLIFGAQLVHAAEALDLLENANEAAHKLNYSGTYVYHHGEHVEVLRVSHRVDKRGEMHKVEVLDGPHREFLRINDEIYCHMADGKTVRIDKSPVQRFFPAVVPDDLANLARYYIPRLGRTEKVAGRDCQVVILEPRDSFRFTHVLWLDRQTMLPLKMSTTDNHGAPVSMFVFSEIEDAWVVSPPPGYSKILEAMRPLPGKKRPVLHRVYSDGMSNLSIFIEPLVNSASHLEGLSTESAINIYGRRVADHKVTAIGEVPAAALMETANSVQKR